MTVWYWISDTESLMQKDALSFFVSNQSIFIQLLQLASPQKLTLGIVMALLFAIGIWANFF